MPRMPKDNPGCLAPPSVALRFLGVRKKPCLGPASTAATAAWPTGRGAPSQAEGRRLLRGP